MKTIIFYLNKTFFSLFECISLSDSVSKKLFLFIICTHEEGQARHCIFRYLNCHFSFFFRKCKILLKYKFFRKIYIFWQIELNLWRGLPLLKIGSWYSFKWLSGGVKSAGGVITPDGTFKFGSDVLEELKCGISDEKSGNVNIEFVGDKMCWATCFWRCST